MSKKEPKTRKLSYIVGLFKENIENIDTFAINMYYSYYYHTIVEELERIETAKLKAMLEGKDVPDTPAEDLEYFRELFEMVGQMQQLTRNDRGELDEEEVFH